VRVPIGVISIIFESRPNVIVDIAALCIKSGNAVIVRGGKEALYSNNVLEKYIVKALEKSGLPASAVQQLEDRRHEAIGELVQLEDYLDLVIPRGREELIRSVSEKSRVAVIKHMRGMCHLYIDSEANTEKAIKIAVNAKTSNPSTCNSIETLLVHQDIADKIMPNLLKEMFKKGVEIRGDKNTCKYDARCVAATEEDWSAEYLDLILSIKIVTSYEEAIAHIQKYSSLLTDAIVTENKKCAQNFINDIDSAVVLVNASNRLTDGGVFGLGAEIGISTSRIHMRGPMGLEDLTVTRYNVIGNGQIRE
ncbi:MAG: glutamate-5-semialdehyde dehydrogenase, partial [Minisyncoccia bacterium]